MSVAGMSLVQKFDFTRFEAEAFNGWDHSRQAQIFAAADLFYTVGFSSNASDANGCMVLRPAVTVDNLVREWNDEEDLETSTPKRFPGRIE